MLYFCISNRNSNVTKLLIKNVKILKVKFKCNIKIYYNKINVDLLRATRVLADKRSCKDAAVVNQ